MKSDNDHRPTDKQWHHVLADMRGAVSRYVDREGARAAREVKKDLGLNDFQTAVVRAHLRQVLSRSVRWGQEHHNEPC